MSNNKTAVLLAALLCLPTFALSSGVRADWSGNVEGGTVLEGDETGSLLRFKLSNSERPLNQQFYADWIRGSNSNSYRVGYEPQYWFTDNTYAFGEASVLTSRVQLIDQQRNLFAGLGIQLLNSSSQSLFAEIGAGQTSTEFTTIGSETQETTATVGRIGASQTLTDLFKLELDGEYSTSDELDQTTAEAGLSFRVPGGAIKYTYRLRTIEPTGQPEIETTDTFVSFNYGF